jgi:hypothetical protein
VIRHAARVDVELLVVPNCPHEQAVYELTRSALNGLDLIASITTTVIGTEEEAQARGFIGSPTILVNGQDPFAEPGASVGIACRMYPTLSGLAGVPPLGELRAALQRAKSG